MKKITYLLCLAAIMMLSLTACSSMSEWHYNNLSGQKYYDDGIKAVMGKSENNLLRIWGPPSKSYESSDKTLKYLTYYWYDEGVYDSKGTMYLPASACKTVFTLQNGKVINYSSEGNIHIAGNFLPRIKNK